MTSSNTHAQCDNPLPIVLVQHLQRTQAVFNRNHILRLLPNTFLMLYLQNTVCVCCLELLDKPSDLCQWMECDP